MKNENKTLTLNDKKNALRVAATCTRGAIERWAKRAEVGLTDEALAKALSYELGIAGGCSGTSNRPNVDYQGAGFKIWASWGSTCRYEDEPIFQGQSTLMMARDVFGIADPSDAQMALF